MRIYFCKKGVEQFAKLLQTELPNDEVKVCAENKVQEVAKNADVLIPITAPITKEILSLSSVKLIQQFGIGLDSVDIEAATEANIPVCNIPAQKGGNAISVAELTVFHMLALARRYKEASVSLESGSFVNRSVGICLKQKTALIIGFGAIGQEIAKRLRAFDMRLISVSRSGKTVKNCPVDYAAQSDELEQLLPQADFVILAVPLTSETKDLINTKEFQLMKPETFIINVARGGVINYDALLSALKNKQISGAGLDVFWHEPIDPVDPILKYNVIATPHMGGITHYSLNQIAKEVAANIERLREGKELLYRNNLAT